MSYQERNNTVSLMCTLLIFGFYGVNVYRMSQEGNFNSTNVFSLWATVIVLAIIVNILSNILAQIAASILHMIRTREEERFTTDERDKLIGLTGTRNAYGVFSIGVLVSMGSLVINMPPLVMFNLLIFSAMLAEIVGDCSRIYLYRRGV